MQNDDPDYFERLPQVVRGKSRNAKWYSGKTHNPAFHLADDSTYQAFIKNYYALITGLDDVVGKIRDQLNELRIADNTVIILTSDNGFFCGSRQLAGKALLYDESARAPLIVYYPGYAKNKGIKKQSLISIVDIAPSILDLAGIDKPAFMPGESFIPVVRGDTDEIHEAVFGENNFDNFHPVISEVKDPDNYQSVRSKFVRTKDYKFIRYHECHPVIEELFKVSDDPSEFVNLINNAEYKDVAEKMRNKLEAFEKNYVSY
jgi:arylsulfatase A-like enzyme